MPSSDSSEEKSQASDSSSADDFSDILGILPVPETKVFRVAGVILPKGEPCQFCCMYAADEDVAKVAILSTEADFHRHVWGQGKDAHAFAMANTANLDGGLDQLPISWRI